MNWVVYSVLGASINDSLQLHGEKEAIAQKEKKKNLLCMSVADGMS